MLTSRLRIIATIAAAGAALGACGSSSSTKPAASNSTNGATTSSVGSRYDTTTSAAPDTTTTSAGATTNALSQTVASHLSGLHGMAGITVTVGADGGLIIKTAEAAGSTQGKTICDDAAMVAGTAAMTIDSSDGSKIGGRAAGGQCA